MAQNVVRKPSGVNKVSIGPRIYPELTVDCQRPVSVEYFDVKCSRNQSNKILDIVTIIQIGQYMIL